jgi:hypothetical protein
MTNARTGAQAPCVADDLSRSILGIGPGCGELQDAWLAALHFHSGCVRSGHEDGMQFGQVKVIPAVS